MEAYIVGAETTQFGELWNVSPRRLAHQAVAGALKQADLPPDAIDGLFVGNMLAGSLGGQEHLGPFFAEELGFRCCACTVEGACASGGLAAHTAILAVRSGLYSQVVVLGIEKMTDHKPEEVATALMGAGSDEERTSGVTFPGLYAMIARKHMEEYGTKEEEMAAVAVKNHFHASLNPKAQFRKPITIEQVLASPRVADPLKLLDCSPISDGAAAIVISSKPRGSHVTRVLSSTVGTDTLGLASRVSLTELKSTKMAAQKAFEEAGVGPGDVDVAEVHDCFTIAEILALEDLGFFSKGEAAGRIFQGAGRLRSGLGCVVNTSGGLKGCGHPVGATGVKQLAEVHAQLAATAGKRQVEGARIGLTHNVGGSGATAVVHILQKKT